MKKIISLVFVSVLLISAITFCVNELKTPDPVYYEYYIVQKGDTLWSIAQLSDMYNKVEISHIISDIQESSNCTTTIYPGQILYIPMYEQ